MIWRVINREGFQSVTVRYILLPAVNVIAFWAKIAALVDEGMAVCLVHLFGLEWKLRRVYPLGIKSHLQASVTHWLFLERHHRLRICGFVVKFSRQLLGGLWLHLFQSFHVSLRMICNESGDPWWVFIQSNFSWKQQFTTQCEKILVFSSLQRCRDIYGSGWNIICCHHPSLITTSSFPSLRRAWTPCLGTFF